MPNGPQDATYPVPLSSPSKTSFVAPNPRRGTAKARIFDYATMSIDLPKGVRSKIGQMPGELRVEINRRLHAREKYAVVVAWVNAQPAALAVLKRLFHGALVTPANLSEWKQSGGYAGWLRQEEEMQRRVAPAMRAAGAARAAVASTPPQEPLHVESAIAGKTEEGLPVLVLMVNGLPAQVSVFTTKWLVHKMVPMEGGPPHAPARVTLQGRTSPAFRNVTDDPVILELCRCLLLDYREGNLVTGPREIPTPEEAARSRWIINAQKDTIRREGGAVRS